MTPVGAALFTVWGTHRHCLQLEGCHRNPWHPEKSHSARWLCARPLLLQAVRSSRAQPASHLWNLGASHIPRASEPSGKGCCVNARREREKKKCYLLYRLEKLRMYDSGQNSAGQNGVTRLFKRTGGLETTMRPHSFVTKEKGVRPSGWMTPGVGERPAGSQLPFEEEVCDPAQISLLGSWYGLRLRH